MNWRGVIKLDDEPNTFALGVDYWDSNDRAELMKRTSRTGNKNPAAQYYEANEERKLKTHLVKDYEVLRRGVDAPDHLSFSGSLNTPW